MPFDSKGYVGSYSYQRKKASKISSLVGLLFSKQFLIVFLIAAGVLLWQGPLNDQFARLFSKKNKVEINSQNVLSEKINVEEKKEVPNEAVLRQELLEKLNGIMVVNDEFSISIENLKTGQSFGINETTAYHAASTMKLLVATTVLTDVEEGKLSFDTILSGYSVKKHLELMINRSSNDSWAVFNSRLTFAREQEMADKLGLSGIVVNQNQATTDTMKKLLSTIYNGKVLRKENKELLFSYMQNTNVENRLTPGVPNGVKFYHKEGSLETRLHDVGIVEHKKYPYVIAIYTKGGEQQARLKAFQEASSAVYEYFDSL